MLFRADGDRYVYVRIDGRRYRIDPNRIFTMTGILDKIVPRPTQKHARAFAGLSRWITRNLEIAIAAKKQRVLTTLHNNTDDDRYGPRLSILTEKKLLGTDNRIVEQHHEWDIDNFYLMSLMRSYRKLKDNYHDLGGSNMVVQNDNPRDFGYLSNWAICKGIEYINLEVHHGHPRTNRYMIAVAQRLFGETKADNSQAEEFRDKPEWCSRLRS